MTTPAAALLADHTERWRPPDDAPCTVLARTEGAAAAARVFMPERADLVTGAPNPDFDGGRRAVDLCRRCPAREACLVEKARRNERLSIMGGAGGARHRALRRAWQAGPERFAAVAAAHFRRLDGVAAEAGDDELLEAGGAHRTCGLRASWSAGCRCQSCGLATALEEARAKIGLPRSMKASAA